VRFRKERDSVEEHKKSLKINSINTENVILNTSHRKKRRAGIIPEIKRENRTGPSGGIKIKKGRETMT